MKSSKSQNISIIIPVLNEEAHLSTLLQELKGQSLNRIKEIIVVDGGSTDQTVNKAIKLGISVLHSGKGRARQMNKGAQHAKGDILYFLHADTFPPKNFDNLIVEAVARGQEAGCFRMKFDHHSRFLKFFSWFSRMNYRFCRGGDQSLFITKKLFLEAKGFNEDYVIYEDNEFIGRLYKLTDFTILPQNVHTSARKYEENGMVKLQYHFSVIHLKRFFGAGPQELYQYYKKNITA